jgi:glutamyl-tRNA reductase
MMSAITKKILHDPTLYLKNSAGADGKSLGIDMVQKLFKLDD